MPDKKNDSQNAAKKDYRQLLVLVMLALALSITLLAIQFPEYIPAKVNFPKNEHSSSELPKFASCGELKDKLAEAREQKRYGGDVLETLSFGTAQRAALSDSFGVSFDVGSGSGSADYSRTNVQVEGVDEADIVKTDGKYIYTVSGKEITISQAYPPERAKLLSTIGFEDTMRPREVFVDGNNLMVFGAMSGALSYYSDGAVNSADSSVASYPYYGVGMTFVSIYNLSNPNEPKLKRTVKFEGSYLTSRKIGSIAYFVINSRPDYRILESDRSGVSGRGGSEDYNLISSYSDIKYGLFNKKTEIVEPISRCSDVSYIDPIIESQYIHIIALPINDYDRPIVRESILGASQNVYASQDNLYIASARYRYYPIPFPRPLGNVVPESIKPEREKTIIHKFALEKMNIDYVGEGDVPGRVLNQFSMDEHKGYFRIATTIGNVSRGGGSSTNNVYILDKKLNRVSEIEDIAPGEKIYSARFMGDKAYLVTFKKVDPFFTLDLSNPLAPKILGKLKIPGYSDYLHPYDENHIIGIGKDTQEAEGGDFAWYQGLKMAIFDVSDFDNPRQMYVETIGDRGTDSPVLNDHKAFLFSREKNLLVIPVTLAELPESVKQQQNRRGNEYGEFTFQGAYVYDISLNRGFRLKGRVSHIDDEGVYIKSGYSFGSENSIKRSLYIDQYLYTISDGKIKVNKLANMDEVGTIDFGDLKETP